MRHKPTTLWKSKDDWAKVVASAVASGSQVQAANVLEMALQDLAALHDAIEYELAPSFTIRSIDAPIVPRART